MYDTNRVLTNFQNLSIIVYAAPWPSGKAEDCKSFTPGSNPGGAFVENPHNQAGCGDFSILYSHMPKALSASLIIMNVIKPIMALITISPIFLLFLPALLISIVTPFAV